MKPKDWYGVAIKPTPLHYCETVEEAKPFFKQGFKGDEIVESIHPAMHSVDNFDLLKEFLEHGANPNAGLPDAGPIHIHTDARFLLELLKYGADVNARDRFGRTPIHCCTNLDSLKLLIDYGANPNILDEDGELPEDDFLDDDEGRLMKEYIINARSEFMCQKTIK